MWRCLRKSSVIRGRRINAPVDVEITGAHELTQNPNTQINLPMHAQTHLHTATHHTHELNHKHEHKRAHTNEHAPTYTHTKYPLFCCAKNAQTSNVTRHLTRYAHTCITFFLSCTGGKRIFLTVHVIVSSLQGVKFCAMLRSTPHHYLVTC
jgi:hypothetical protein